MSLVIGSAFIDNISWSTYTPTVASGGGSITTLGAVSGRYKQIGKIVFCQIVVNITTNGTGSSHIRATLPVTAVSSQIFGMCGQENAVNGKMLQGIIDPSVSSGVVCITFYDNTYPGSNGCKLVVSGSYEAS